jgi:hypothetical protein
MTIILETAVEGEKDVQDIDVHGRFEKLVVTLLVMRAFSNFPGALTRMFHKFACALAWFLIRMEHFPQSTVRPSTALPRKTPLRTNYLRDHHSNL